MTTWPPVVLDDDPNRTSIERRLNSDLAISLAGATLADGYGPDGHPCDGEAKTPWLISLSHGASSVLDRSQLTKR